MKSMPDGNQGSGAAPYANGVVTEVVRAIVDRVTYHNADNGWSVLRVRPFDTPHQLETVVVHQTKVFAGATMEFRGAWTIHPRHGRQFKAAAAIEKKPATQAALEKYLGSGLIKGVGSKTARKIVRHFGRETLEVFEENIARLTEVTGIAQKKLDMISEAWSAHRAIRDVMMFLQSYGISTLFAVRIYKTYGDRAIECVREDPYRLANDIYGIGFFSADKIALSMGLAIDSPQRIMAAIKHVLDDSRQFGHCYLTAAQIESQVRTLLNLPVDDRVPALLDSMEGQGLLMVRQRGVEGRQEACYYAKSLYYDEQYVARRITAMRTSHAVDRKRVAQWIERYCGSQAIELSLEQTAAVQGIVSHHFSILTGGPGCGKTTSTRILVRLLQAMQRKVVLAAPTGRAAQRMLDVIGVEARTIHRLLEWKQSGFQKNEDAPLSVDFLIVDECSMLDISLTAALFKAVPARCQVLFIGDADQLPAVGAGNVLKDILASQSIPCYRLSQIFRQAEQSLIVRYAHQINAGQIPYIDSPFEKPELWQSKADCFFMDSDEVTQDQIGFVTRVKRFFETPDGVYPDAEQDNPYEFRVGEPMVRYGTELVIPEKFAHVDLERIHHAEGQVAELRSVLKRVHPWSSLRYGLSAVDVVRKLYLEWIPKYLRKAGEIQILSPMTRGSLGTLSLNSMIQAAANPVREGVHQLVVGERVFREGDRVIHRRNNYDLGVFNGDIGVIEQIDALQLTASVRFQDGRSVAYQREDTMELDLAYAITIHKSQGSEFDIVILPLLTQHFKMLFRNLLYTGLTRARKLAILVGTRKALAMAIHNQDTSRRQTALCELLIDGRAPAANG